MQQVILHLLGPKLPVVPFFVGAFLLTLPLAMLSWHWVEAPMLRAVRAPVDGPRRAG